MQSAFLVDRRELVKRFVPLSLDRGQVDPFGPLGRLHQRSLSQKAERSETEKINALPRGLLFWLKRCARAQPF